MFKAMKEQMSYQANELNFHEYYLVVLRRVDAITQTYMDISN